MQIMRHWLNVAAQRGLPTACAICLGLEQGFELRALGGGDERESLQASVEDNPAATLYSAQAEATSKDANMDHVDDLVHLLRHDLQRAKEAIQALLLQGESIDSVLRYGSRRLASTEAEQRLPLSHRAAHHGKLEWLVMFRELGADMGARDPRMGRSPLLFALMAGQAKTARLLLDDERETFCRDIWGLTALHFLYMVPESMIDMFADRLFAQEQLAFSTVSSSKSSRCLVSPRSISKTDTPLCYATMMGSSLTVQALLRRMEPKDIMAQVLVAIPIACECHYAGICDLLIRTGSILLSSISNPFSYVGKGDLYGMLFRHGKSVLQH